VVCWTTHPHVHELFLPVAVRSRSNALARFNNHAPPLVLYLCLPIHVPPRLIIREGRVFRGTSFVLLLPSGQGLAYGQTHFQDVVLNLSCSRVQAPRKIFDGLGYVYHVPKKTGDVPPPPLGCPSYAKHFRSVAPQYVLSVFFWGPRYTQFRGPPPWPFSKSISSCLCFFCGMGGQVHLFGWA